MKTHKYIHRLYELDELYDLINDPKETRNVIDDPAYAEVQRTHKDRMMDWQMETSGVIPHELDSRK